MKSDFKKIFFSSLLVVLLIISNIIGFKYTAFGDMIVSANFVTYPFIILCILILLDKYGKKDTYYAIVNAVFIQVFILLSYSLVTNMDGQMIIPDLSNSINSTFLINEVPLMVSLIAFMLSNYAIIYLFNYFKRIGKKIIGVVLGTLSSLIVYNLIYILICYYNIEKEILINLVLSHISVNVIMSIIVIVLFYILKERDCIYTVDDIKTVNVKFEELSEVNDKTILDVITLKEKEVKKRSGRLEEKGKNDKKKADKKKSVKSSNAKEGTKVSSKVKKNTSTKKASE